MAREVSALSRDVAKCHQSFIADTRVAGGLERMRRPSGSARALAGRPAGGNPADGSRSRRPCTGQRWGCPRERYTGTNLERRLRDRPWVQRAAANPARLRLFRSRSHRGSYRIPVARCLAIVSRWLRADPAGMSGAGLERQRLKRGTQSETEIRSLDFRADLRVDLSTMRQTMRIIFYSLKT